MYAFAWWQRPAPGFCPRGPGTVCVGPVTRKSLQMRADPAESPIPAWQSDEWSAEAPLRGRDHLAHTEADGRSFWCGREDRRRVPWQHPRQRRAAAKASYPEIPGSCLGWQTLPDSVPQPGRHHLRRLRRQFPCGARSSGNGRHRCRGNTRSRATSWIGSA